MSNYYVKMECVKTDGMTIRSVMYPFDTVKDMEAFRAGTDALHKQINSTEP